MTRKLGLVLGSGSARGWAHVGVIRELVEIGCSPDIVCGCSVGAFVGAAYANRDIDALEEWVLSLSWQEVLKLLDVGFSGGLLKGGKLLALFERRFVDRSFADLALPFACVATELATGREIWLREGMVSSAIHASTALPGLFRPVMAEGRLLVDGGLVNPVPVSLARAMGADVVIAVDLGSDLVGRELRRPDAKEQRSGGLRQSLAGRLGFASEQGTPSLASVLATSIQIMQTRIARSRLAGEPADVLLSPRLAQLGLMDYHRAEEAIAEGREAVKRMLPAIESVLKS